jgi:hypothetical protein
MSFESWMVKAWPMVEWYLPDVTAPGPALCHVQTQVRPGSDRPGRRFGDTVWIGVVQGRSVGLAWDWVELQPGVVMLADPNSIISNLRFLTAQRTYQEPVVGLISLNRLVHELPWQSVVLAVLQAQSQDATPVAPRPAAAAEAQRVLGALRAAA